jgi:hypothetical protein
MITRFSVHPRRGVALITTLSILVVLTLLAVGLLITMRLERRASGNMAHIQRAKILTDAALAHATAILQENIPPPVLPGASSTNPTQWIINPGMLTLVTGTATIQEIPLSSNPDSSYESIASDANINARLPSGKYAVLPSNEPMRVAWIPVLNDPSTTASADNPITGRYAFWIDDENAKINLNTAYGKPAPGSLNFSNVHIGANTYAGSSPAVAGVYPIDHPTSVNLDTILTTTQRYQVLQAINQSGPLPTIDSFKRVLTNPAILDDNRFHLTAYNRDPEFHVFGKSRMFFQRRTNDSGVSLHRGFPFFQFDRDAEGISYPHLEESNPYAVRAAQAMFANILNRNDWPGMPARSFVDKWGGDAAARREADQLALNFIAFSNYATFGISTNQNAENATRILNKFTDGTSSMGSNAANYPNDFLIRGALSGKPMLPIYPFPMVSEYGLKFSLIPHPSSPGNYSLQYEPVCEFRLPSNYPRYASATNSTLTVGLAYLRLEVIDGATTHIQEMDTPTLANPGISNRLTLSTTGLTINPGSYVQVSLPNTSQVGYFQSGNSLVVAASRTAAPLASTALSASITVRVRARFFVCLLGDAATPSKPLQLAPIWDDNDTTSASVRNAMAPPADAPAERGYLEWSATVTLAGLDNLKTVEIADPRLSGLSRMWTPTPSVTDTLGAANTVSFNENKFKIGDILPGSDPGRRYSIGMLSALPIGMQRGIPGESLRFQPSPNKDQLPDWLLLDLFSPNFTSTLVSNTNTAHQAYPFHSLTYMNATMGRINVNTAILPAGGQFKPPKRDKPLAALFANLPNASTITSNILNNNRSGQTWGPDGRFLYAGEICEISGVADTGASDWEKEQIIRNFAGLLTVRSNVFTVWGVVQAVKKRNTNTDYGTFEPGDVILAERRFRAVVERYVWPGTDGIPGNGKLTSTGAYDASLVSNPNRDSTTLPGKSAVRPDGTFADDPRWERMDGPIAPTYPPAGDPRVKGWERTIPAAWTNSPLDSAANPVGAYMKYRVREFEYVD